MMQIVLHNTELFPVQVTFDNDTVINVGPEDSLTLHAGLDAGVVVQEDRIQTRNITPPASGMSDNDAAASGASESQQSDDRENDEFRPDSMHTI